MPAAKDEFTQPELLYQTVENDILKKIVSGELPGGSQIPTETELCKKLSALADSLSEKIAALSETICGAKAYADDAPAEAVYYRDHVVPAMNELRAVADEMEILVAKKYWPFPTYGDILFSVQ